MHNVSPCIEGLENRRHFAISFSHHVFNVQGYPALPNTIVLGLSADQLSITAELSYPTRLGVRRFDFSVPISRGIRLVNIVGGNKADSITIDQSNGSYSIITNITTHNGNDTVIGGAEPDCIRLGNGVDYVNSGDGNDTLHAGLGHDTLIGGNGNDQFFAGKGPDSIVGGNGHDAFVDRWGRNTIMGGTGHDVYILRDINLDPTNFDKTKDTLKHFGNADDNNSNLVNNIVNAVIGYFL